MFVNQSYIKITIIVIKFINFFIGGISINNKLQGIYLIYGFLTLTFIKKMHILLISFGNIYKTYPFKKFIEHFY